MLNNNTVLGNNPKLNTGRLNTIPPTITVISPKNGDIFYKNRDYTIIWKITGLMNNRVKISVSNKFKKQSFIHSYTGKYRE
jgi:hypothetical protein